MAEHSRARIAGRKSRIKPAPQQMDSGCGAGFSLPSAERLHKRIAASGLCSRRAAEALIREGRVQVNGQVVTEMGVYEIVKGGGFKLLERAPGVSVEEIKNNALEWKNCKSEEQRRKHVSETFVQWSEIHCLPNFNPVRFLIVDLMHCLFLGIAKWIIMRLWIEEGKLNSENLSLMQKRANRIQVPVDIGRLPSKISMGKGFSGFTADQWKTFIMVGVWELLTLITTECKTYILQVMQYRINFT